MKTVTALLRSGTWSLCNLTAQDGTREAFYKRALTQAAAERLAAVCKAQTTITISIFLKP